MLTIITMFASADANVPSHHDDDDDEEEEKVISFFKRNSSIFNDHAQVSELIKNFEKPG